MIFREKYKWSMMKDEKSKGLFGGQLDFYFLLYLYFL